MTRDQSPRLTTFGAYGALVTGFVGCPVPSLVPSELLPFAAGEMSTYTPSLGSSTLLLRMLSTNPRLYSSSPTPPSRGGGGAGWLERSKANGVTAPQCGPTNSWT